MTTTVNLKSPLSVENKTIQLRIADYEICAMPTGIFALDGGAMFGMVPKVLWEKSNPADEHNRIPMEARALLLKSKDRNILIDTGNGSDFVSKYGEKLGSKFSEMYGIDPKGPTLLNSLKKYNLNPDQITDVILTHLHFDHAGGATRFHENQIQATFPNAKYYLQKTNLETAQNPNKREKSSYLAANFEPLLKSNQLQLIDGPKENILPNISVTVSNGHTQGHQAVIIKDESCQLVYCGDVIPTSSHVRSAWIMGYDLDALKLIEEKSELLKISKISQNKKTYYYFEHDPYCDLATVIADRDDFKVDERFNLI
jgi:glyoxylase-like metal-dependent hydrolase (beta-lactamase superfamily II)